MLKENVLLWSAPVLSLVTQSCRAGVAVCKPERGFKKWSGHAIRRPQLAAMSSDRFGKAESGELDGQIRPSFSWNVGKECLILAHNASHLHIKAPCRWQSCL